MREEDKDRLNLLSLKYFEERGIKIDRNWSGLEALTAVARLASQKLEEEERIKKDQETKKPVIEGVHQGSSSTRDDKGLRLVRVSDKNERVKTLKQPVPRSSDKKGREKAQKQPVPNAVSDKHLKKKRRFSAASPDKILGDAMKASFRTWEGGDDEWIPQYTKKRSVSKRHKREEKVLNPT